MKIAAYALLALSAVFFTSGFLYVAFAIEWWTPFGESILRPLAMTMGHMFGMLGGFAVCCALMSEADRV